MCQVVNCRGARRLFDGARITPIFYPGKISLDIVFYNGPDKQKQRFELVLGLITFEDGATANYLG